MQHNAVLFMQTAVLPPTAYTLSWNCSSDLLKIAYRECLLHKVTITFLYSCSQIMLLF